MIAGSAVRCDGKQLIPVTTAGVLARPPAAPILEDGRVVAVHPVMDGRGQRRITAGHRSAPPPPNSQTPRNGPPQGRSGDIVALRPLAFYDAVGRRLAVDGAVA